MMKNEADELAKTSNNKITNQPEFVIRIPEGSTMGRNKFTHQYARRALK